jgi:hypothetical protein
MSEQTTAYLNEMFESFFRYNESNIWNAAPLNFLGDAVEMRGLRVSTKTRTIMQIVWVILVAGVALVFLGLVFIGAQSSFIQTLITSLFSVFILMSLLALVHLAHSLTAEFAVMPIL